MNVKLKTPPISGEYEEVLFELPGPWHQQFWNYVKFTTEAGLEWVGGFREGDYHNFLVAEVENKGIACVISGGHGYIVDIEQKKKIKDLETDRIIDIMTDQITNSFYISRWWDLKIVDTNFIEIDIPVPIDCDGIFFKEISHRKVNLEIKERVYNDFIKNRDWYIDLDERIIKHWAELQS